jgi:hypothetical protein
MKSDIRNARDCGVTPGFPHDNTKRVALQRAADEMRCAVGRTIYVPTGGSEFAGTFVEISTATRAAGTVCIRGEGSATVAHSVGSNLFVLTDASNNCSSGGTIESPGRVQWDGKYLTVGDLERNVVDRIAVTGTQGNIEATVDFNNVQLAGSWIHGNKIVDPEPGDANVLFFDYPKGGTSTRTITDGIDGPLSVTVSSVPK